MHKLIVVALSLLAATNISAGMPGGVAQEEIFHARDKVMPALVHIQPVIKNYNTVEL